MSKRVEAVANVLYEETSLNGTETEALAVKVLNAADNEMFDEENIEHAVLSLHLLGGRTVSDCRSAVILVCASLAGNREYELAAQSLLLPVDEVTPEMIEAYDRLAKQ